MVAPKCHPFQVKCHVHAGPKLMDVLPFGNPIDPVKNIMTRSPFKLGSEVECFLGMCKPWSQDLISVIPA